MVLAGVIASLSLCDKAAVCSFVLFTWPPIVCSVKQANGSSSFTLLSASIALPYTSSRLIYFQIAEHTFLFYGAGEAGVGIGMMISEAIAIQTGRTVAEAAKNIWFVDSKGLVRQTHTA